MEGLLAVYLLEGWLVWRCRAPLLHALPYLLQPGLGEEGSQALSGQSE